MTKKTERNKERNYSGGTLRGRKREREKIRIKRGSIRWSGW